MNAKPGVLAVMDDAYEMAIDCDLVVRAEQYREARATVDRLVAALVPFAALLHEGVVRGHETSAPDSQPIFGINNALITLGDLRRANAQLAAFRGES